MLYYFPVKCMQVCEANIKPVCGSDGNIYKNLCELKSHNCNNPSVVQSDLEVCGEMSEGNIKFI